MHENYKNETTKYKIWNKSKKLWITNRIHICNIFVNSFAERETDLSTISQLMIVFIMTRGEIVFFL